MSAFSDQLGIDIEEALRTATVPAVPDPFPAPGTPEFAAFMLECQQNSWKAAMEVLEPYLNTLPRTAEIVRTTNQSSVTGHVLFDAIGGSLSDDNVISLSGGVITAEVAGVFAVRAYLEATINSGGSLVSELEDGAGGTPPTASGEPPKRMVQNHNTRNTTSPPNTSSTEMIWTPGAGDDLTLELTASSVSHIVPGTRIIITEVR